MADFISFFQSDIGLAVAFFILVLIILWVLLSFAIFSIRKSARESSSINKQILDELKKLNHGVEMIDLVAPDSHDQATMQKCPKCGFESSIEVMECVRCGYRLPMP